MSQASPPPELPEPRLARWQPLRLGLVELFHYDSEEFWFRDGHLMLRGNNGTGKSKVLSLTLPFLLDANLSASRVEPDGDRNKRMEWNLLMGERHKQRVGYTWLELGRRDENGQAHYLTLGCGLRAVAGKSGTDAWYFLTSLRVNRDLWLMNGQRVALLRDRLVEALGPHGDVFATAKDYKRAVDERLFKLGEERYAALVNTLIQLRQPQLSKNPDEQHLSNALTEALSPLDREALEVVAESMGQLEQQQQELAGLEELSRAIAGFVRRYRQYAAIATRRSVRKLKQVQSQLEDTSSRLREAEQALTQAAAAQAHWEKESQRLEGEVKADEHRIEVLKSDPTMQDAQRMDAVRQHERQCQEAQGRAQHHLEAARTRLAQEERHLAQLTDQAGQTRDALQQSHQATVQHAREAGIPGLIAQALESAGFPDGVQEGGTALLTTLQPLLQESVIRRREQIEVMRQRLTEVAQAQERCKLARSERDVRMETFEAARDRAHIAFAAVEEAGTMLASGARAHLERLQVLKVPQAEELLAELGLWVETLAGPNPLRRALELAWTVQERSLAARAAALETRRKVLQEEHDTLEAERTQLLQGITPDPPLAHTREPESRTQRPGAPLWQLLDFKPRLAQEHRAGLEAALEAAGLLDAWVHPDGTLSSIDQDVLLVPRAPRSESLGHWLTPALPAGTSITQDIVERLLACIACSTHEPADAECWISPEGGFRLGPARGHWHKDTAHYIGHAAREAARQARLAQVAGRLTQLLAELAECEATATQLRQQRDLARQEQQEAPGEEPLRGAHATHSAAEAQRREAQQRLGDADAKLAGAESALAGERERLALDARSLQLPADSNALDRIDRAVQDYQLEGRELLGRVREHQRALQALREQQSRAGQVRKETDTAAEELLVSQRALRAAQQTVEVLQDSVGKAVDELLRQIDEVRARRVQHEAQHKEARHQLVQAAGRASAAQTSRDELQVRQGERSAERRQVIESLQGFARRTGFFAVAVPDLTLPDTATPWGIEAAVGLARRADAALEEIAAEDSDWSRIQDAINRELQQLTLSLSAQQHRANIDHTDHGLVVAILYHDREERPDRLEKLLLDEIQARRFALTTHERAIIEQHLQSEIAVHLQNRIAETEQQVGRINAELEKRPTSTGVRYRLIWRALPEQSAGAVAGLVEARRRLLRTSADAWSAEDRRQVGEFLQQCIQAERARDDQSPLGETLSRALDYRRWHEFVVERQQDRQWKPLSGPSSSGERALGLTVPLFAAASSHYWGADPHAPRLVLLDEAFAGIDDHARASCMALIREFDLDFVMTSEREWGCYAELPGLSICQLNRQDGMDAVLVTRWTWDGRERRREGDPAQRFPQAATDDEGGEGMMQLDLA